MQDDLNTLTNEKCDLLREDNRNLNRSRIGTLQMSFNETIFELDLEKDNEITVELNKFKNELDQMKEKCTIRLNELKFKMEQKNINKKQKKLNFLRETLDLQLDTLVSLKMDRLDEDLLHMEDSGEQERSDFDLAKESDQILLEKVSFDETNTHLDKSFFKTAESIDETDEASASSSTKRRLSRSVELNETASPVKKASRSMSSDRGSKENVSKKSGDLNLKLNRNVRFSETDSTKQTEGDVVRERRESSQSMPVKQQTPPAKEYTSKIPVRTNDEKRATRYLFLK